MFDYLKSWYSVTVLIQNKKEIEERKFKIFASNKEIAIKVVINKFKKENKEVLELKEYKKL